MAEQAAQPPLDLQSVDNLNSPANFRPVFAQGYFVAQWPIYLDNRPYEGKAGFYLLMPFKIENSDKTILVMRGWLPRNTHDRLSMPVTPVPEGRIKIEGLVRESVSHVMQLGGEQITQPGAIKQNLDLTELSKASGLRLENYIVEQTSPASDGLVRDWPKPALGMDKHRGYAFQWYGLAVTALLFFIFTGLKRAS